MNLRGERSGLILLIASLLVMAVSVYVLLDYQIQQRQQQAREQGLALARLFSGMPWQQVIGDGGQRGLLEVLRQGQSNPDFAYAQVVDNSGRIIDDASATGIIAPAFRMPAGPAEWLGQELLGEGDERFIESRAPLFDQGELRGFIRIGYRVPRLRPSYRQLPIIATLSLPIFLLMPLFYFFLRREMRPLQAISRSLDRLAENQDNPPELQPGPELGDFMERFNRFLDTTQSRILQLQQEQDEQLVQSRLLAYKNSKIESILQALPEAVLVIDESGSVSYANEKLRELLGREPSGIIGHQPAEWCHSVEILRALSGQFDKGELLRVDGPELAADQPALTRRKLEIRSYPLFAPQQDNRLLGRLVVIRDVTDLHHEQLRQAEFISQIAHELKTPLNVLSMYSESLIDEGLTSAEHRIEAANIIHDEVERLANLIQNLLSISQYELGGLSIERQRVRLRDLLEDCFNTLAHGDRGGEYRFELDLPPDLPALMLDKPLMRVAINNLLSNALKYSPPGSRIRLEAEANDEIVEIRVIDEGYGIAEQDLPHIFDKFYRSEDENIRKQTGHGLGLSLTRHIIHIHQGEISVESETGKGSLFRIRLRRTAA